MLRTRVFIQYVHLKPPKHRSCNRLHLNISHIFTQTHSRTSMKHGIPVRILRPKYSVDHPPLRLKLVAILTPYTLHSPHRVRMKRHQTTLLNQSSIWPNVVVFTHSRIHRQRWVQSHTLRYRRVRFSDPTFRNLLIFHIKGIKSMNLLELISTASAKAFISSSPEPPPSPATAERQPGSTSKANLQILSKANLSKTSCKSIISPVSEAFWRIGSNLVSISKSTLSTTKFLNDLVLNS
ncbi:hypothetical protein F8388_011157 [Cannabis sativa]|uniref:Uncharacterized protein n=1 Tax=Cannabis sativa TaxID=3483 RepID=A0A7J6E8K1_CANSA|nr:hypothetical protein F8388_011157 [Cannabis sativa]